MAQEEIELAPSDQSNLLRLEKVGKGTVLTRQIADLVGRSQFFAEFSREDITVLADYMEVYRAQPGEMIIREGDAGDVIVLVAVDVRCAVAVVISDHVRSPTAEFDATARRRVSVIAIALAMMPECGRNCA